jgi:hypothetical protein
MPSPRRVVRISLPQALLRKISDRAAGEKSNVNAVILRAIKSDLRRSGAKPLRNGR